MLLGAAFGALFGSVVPVGMIWGGLRPELALSGGSLVILLTLLYWTVKSLVEISRLDEANRSLFHGSVKATMLVFSVVGVIAQSVVLLNVAPHWDPLLLSSGVLLLLALAAFLYVRLMFIRPSE